MPHLVARVQNGFVLAGFTSYIIYHAISKYFFVNLMSGRIFGFTCQNNQMAHGFACAKSSTELFKRSKDAASLLVCTRKKFLVGGMWTFCD